MRREEGCAVSTTRSALTGARATSVGAEVKPGSQRCRTADRHRRPSRQVNRQARGRVRTGDKDMDIDEREFVASSTDMWGRRHREIIPHAGSDHEDPQVEVAGP